MRGRETVPSTLILAQNDLRDHAERQPPEETAKMALWEKGKEK